MPAHTRCRICDTALPAPFLDLGTMPLANAFLSEPTQFENEVSYPLAVTACTLCSLAQLTYTVPADVLYRDYIYVSSTSDGVRAHADVLAEDLIRRYDWGAHDLVVEIASNDGTVLQAFQSRGMQVLGVEPAANIAAIAAAVGVPTLAEFFTEPTATDIARRVGRVAGIVARHVFAHVDDLHDFVRGAEQLLEPGGVLVIEVPYFGDLLAHFEFDTVYHEHLSYFAIEPFERLMAMHDLRVVDVDRVTLHGGSMILHICRADSERQPSTRLEEMRVAERGHAVSSTGRLAAFAAGVREWRREFESLVDDLVAGGGQLVGYGAAAKANTLLNHCPRVTRSLSSILDRSPHKHGRYTPGTHLRVDPVEQWQDAQASHMLVLAWNFKDEIMRQMQPFADTGGRFVIPIPRPIVV